MTLNSIIVGATSQLLGMKDGCLMGLLMPRNTSRDRVVRAWTQEMNRGVKPIGADRWLW